MGWRCGGGGGGAPQGDFVRENSGVDLEGLRPYCTCQQCGFGADDRGLSHLKLLFLMRRGGGAASADSQSGA